MPDKDQRTEKATPRRREREREEGKVAVSKELIGMAVLLFAAGVTALDPFGARLALTNCTRQLLASLDQVPMGQTGIWLRPIFVAAGMLVIPVGLAAMLAAVVVGFSQTQGLVSVKKLKPSFAFFNPLPKLKQTFGSIEALTTLLLSLGKVAVVGVVVTRVFYRELPVLKTLGNLGVTEILHYLGRVVLDVAVQAGALLVLFAIVDYLLIFYRTEEKMKMSKQEVKDEHKETEGDPEVKRRLRTRMREAGRRMMAEVPKAAVVVVNPTHYAVALRYDMGQMAAPVLVAKGKNQIAAKIREIARHHGIPVVRNPPLARQLFADCPLDGEVPPQLYGAIAELLALVYRLRGGMVGATA
jgi:flagellar biosynthetic protein FlhB